MRVHIHELNTDLLESAHGEKMPLDATQSFVRIVVSLFNETQLFTSSTVETNLKSQSLLEPLEGKDEELGVVFVGERREWDGSKLPAFKPVHSGGVDCNCLLGTDVRTILQIVVLSLLFGLEPQTSKPSQVLLHHSLIYCSSSLDTFTIIVCNIGPPISLRFDVTQDHVLNGCRHSRYLPRDIRLPIPKGLAEM